MNCVNLCELDKRSRDLNVDVTLGDCLFGAVKLSENANPEKHEYCSYGIEFDLRSLLSLSKGKFGTNVVVFDVDNSSLVHSDNKKNILDEVPTDGLGDTTIEEEAKYFVTVTKSKNNFFLNLNYKGNNFFYANGVKIYQFKTK